MAKGPRESTLASIRDQLLNLDVPLSSTYSEIRGVYAESLPLPDGASTEATLAAIKAKTDNLDVPLSTISTGGGGGEVGLTDEELRAAAVAVSLASLPLPSGASTEATLAAIQAILALIKGKTDNLDVSLSTRAVTGLTDAQLRALAVAVTIASMPLPANASTETTLAAIKAKTDNIDVALSTRAVTGLTDTQLRASPLALPSGASTESTLAAIKAKTDNLDVPLSTISSGGAAPGLTDEELRATPVPVAASALPLPSGASTESTLAAIKAKTDNIDVALSTRAVTGLTDTQLRASALPISAASLPLPTGAGTEATLAAIKAKTDNIDVALSTRAVTGLTDAQLRNTPVPVSVSGGATEATLAAIKAKTDNLDVALSTRAVTGLTDAQLRLSAVPVSAAALPLPAGAATEVTLALIKAKTDNIDVALSTRAVTGLTDAQLRASAVPVSTIGHATEATLALIKAKTDNIDVALSTRAVTGLTDAQLRASALPVSAAALPLPTGASTAALQTQPGVDIGDVTVNNAAGAGAVNIQDGGNSITVDGTVAVSGTIPISAAALPLPSGAATEATLALIKAKTDNLDVALSTRAVTGLTDAQLRASAVPVSLATQPLPTGASTEATLALIKAKTDNIDVALSTRAVTGLTDAQLRASAVPVSAAALPLPSGASTEATLALIKAKTDNIDVALSTRAVTGLTDAQLRASAVPVSLATQPLPTGASTEATLALIKAKTDNIDVALSTRAVTGLTDAQMRALPVPSSAGYGEAITSGLATGRAGRMVGTVSTAALTQVAIRQTAYTEQAANAQRSINSLSASDAAAGVGARTVQLTYYSLSAGVVTGPFVETVTLNGTTAVNTVSTTICYIESIEVLTAGTATASNVGAIQLFAAVAGGGGVIASIAATERRTRYGHHYVPTGATCSVSSAQIDSNAAAASVPLFTCRWRNPVAATNAEQELIQSRGAQGTVSTVEFQFNPPRTVVGPAVIVFYVTPAAVTAQVSRLEVSFFEK